MATQYTYDNKPTSLQLDYIHNEVAASAMADKEIQYCRWDEKTAQLHVTFKNSLSDGDKYILDGIVANTPLNGVE